jgi:hypothetical protein
MTINTDKLYHTVAKQAWQSVNDAADEFNAANGEDSAEAPYLYVFADGSWTIDYPDYIQTTNGRVSAVMVYHCNGPAELADAIEAEEDWDAVEDASNEDAA